MNFAALKGLYDQPLFDLIAQSRAVHLEHWRGEQVQRCSLLSIKTGGCSEDCAYCAQSAHYSTGVGREDLMPVDEIMSAAQRARAQGATRFCMGAAWRGVRDGTAKFEQVLATVRAVSQLGMEVCVTLGEIGPDEARKLKSAGVTALQPQHRYLAGILSGNRAHAQFRRSPNDHRRRPGKRNVGLLRRDYRAGRKG
jgi:biotin synthase